MRLVLFSLFIIPLSTGGGDVNGDGLDDVFVSAYQGESGGMSHLIFGE